MGVPQACAAQVLCCCRGILADYGSVATYCSEHSKAPVLMLPPHVQGVKNAQPGGMHWLQQSRSSSIVFMALNGPYLGDFCCCSVLACKPAYCTTASLHALLVLQIWPASSASSTCCTVTAFARSSSSRCLLWVVKPCELLCRPSQKLSCCLQVIMQAPATANVIATGAS